MFTDGLLPSLASHLPSELVSLLPSNVSDALSRSTLEQFLSNPSDKSNLSLAVTTLLSLIVARYTYKRLTDISLADVRGPGDGVNDEDVGGASWMAGDIPTLFTDTTGTLGARWAEAYGAVCKLRAQIGTKNALLVSDPAALRHIMQSEHADKYIRAPEWYAMADLLAGECIGSVEGDVHRRHRKGIRPAFGVPETRALLPVFNGVANKLCEKWDTLISLDTSEAPILNVAEWISKAALDAFGEVALDYQFGGLDNTPTELAQAMPTVLLETFGTPSPGQLAALSLLQYVPMGLIRWILNSAPVGGRLDHVRNTNSVSQRILLELIEDRKRMMKEGGGGKRDIMSYILRAGLNEDPTAKLSDDEIVAELRFLLLAGQETSANTLAWALFELSSRPHIQSELRAEIRDAREKKAGKEFTAQDLQALPLLNAIIKETLRFDPVIQNMFRESLVDDVLPLSEPIKLKSGKVISDLPIPKGTKLYISVAGYNMLPSVWGPDAQTWNPHRWLKQEDEREGSNTLGMYANLMTFSAGNKGCIGWRFAVLQLQNLLAELMDRFEFVEPKSGPKVVRANCMSTQPMIKGEYEKGAQLPLVVKRAAA